MLIKVRMTQKEKAVAGRERASCISILRNAIRDMEEIPDGEFDGLDTVGVIERLIGKLEARP